jgi:hypothetical protein
MGGAVGLGLCFAGQNCHYLKTLVFFKMLQYRRKLIQLGSNQVCHAVLNDGIPLLAVKRGCVLDVIVSRGAMIVQCLGKGGQPTILIT